VRKLKISSPNARRLGFFQSFFASIAGNAIVETALTLPAVCTLIFFTLELMKINLAKTAIETITAETTFSFIRKGKTEDFEYVIEKYRPTFIPRERIRYWFRFYSSIEQMCSVSPYGGEDIAWPLPTCTDVTGIFIDSMGTGTFLRAAGHINESEAANMLSSNETPPPSSGKAFVLTFVCDYRFSSALIKPFFSGGYNTQYVNNEDETKKYLLWGRGVGIVN
jgi:hypothetical protein